MLMDRLSFSRSLISSPYLPHHFIWPKGNNKSLIHYPLTEAAMRKCLITGNKLNFNHLYFLSRMHGALNRTCRYAYAIHQTHFMMLLNKTLQDSVILLIFFPTFKDKKALLEAGRGSCAFHSGVLISPETLTLSTCPTAQPVESLIYLLPLSW